LISLILKASPGAATGWGLPAPGMAWKTWLMLIFSNPGSLLVSIEEAILGGKPAQRNLALFKTIAPLSHAEMGAGDKKEAAKKRR
jgi:hypothetical protein